MSLVYKSNKSSYGEPLGNLNGILGSQDYSLFYDFTEDKYYKKVDGIRSSLTEIDALTAEHDFQIGVYATPRTMSSTGVVSDVTQSNAIRKWKGQSGHYGLLVEGKATNRFVNSSAPVTQTFEAPAGGLYAVSCLGSGYVTVTGDNVVGSPLIVRESDGFKLIEYTSKIGHNFNVTPSGALSHVQVELLVGFNTATSPFTSGDRINNASTRIADRVKINQTTLQSVISSEGYTLVLQVVPVYYRQGTDAAIARNETRLIVRTPTNQLTLGISRDVDSSTLEQRKYTRVLNTTSSGTSVTSFGGTRYLTSANIENFVFAVSSESVAAAMNDHAGVDSVSTSAGVPSDIYIGSDLAYSATNVAGKFIATKLVVYNRVLSNTEIKEIVSSWT